MKLRAPDSEVERGLALEPWKVDVEGLKIQSLELLVKLESCVNTFILALPDSCVERSPVMVIFQVYIRTF